MTSLRATSLRRITLALAGIIWFVVSFTSVSFKGFLAALFSTCGLRHKQYELDELCTLQVVQLDTGF